jgi:DNA mismatch repair protein MutL
MPIEALPLLTAKRIGSAQVIFDPCSVVKELLDNSFDARATSVSVEISSNTLDVIQVRDNGHGISDQDRNLVCVRHCTSKLRDFSELHLVGGTWLGFRGQALSSLAEISGGLSITTRVEGEIAAEKLEIGKDGEITRFDLYRSEFERSLQRLQGTVGK